MKIRLMAFCLAVFAIGSVANAQGNFDNVQISITHVNGNVYMLQGSRWKHRRIRRARWAADDR